MLNDAVNSDFISAGSLLYLAACRMILLKEVGKYIVSEIGKEKNELIIMIK